MHHIVHIQETVVCFNDGTVQVDTHHFEVKMSITTEVIR